MTQLETARRGKVTGEMEAAAGFEGIGPEELRDLIAAGEAVLPANLNRELRRPLAIGRGLSVKVNANIGSSKDCPSSDMERLKLEAALNAGTHSVMDLSTGGDLGEIRRIILDNCPVMVGAVPIYEVATELARSGREMADMDPDGLFESVERQCVEGLDYITVHCGVTRASVAKLDSFTRIMDCVSRGGSILMNWMRARGRENPLYERFDDLLDIARTHDVTLSLGDGMRPGAVADATDGPQMEELIIIGELAKRARDAGVQVIIEGPGHVPLDQVAANVIVQKRLTGGAPFYVLGPLTTDIAPGWDHIVAAIGGAVAAMAGADFLCYVTPAEHLGLPTVKDVHEGVIGALIAAHTADLARGLKKAWARDIEMSRLRRDLDWEGQFKSALDPAKARQKFHKTADGETCTMCGDLCAIKLAEKEDESR